MILHMKKIIPHLWFDKEAKDAAEVSVIVETYLTTG